MTAPAISVPPLPMQRSQNPSEFASKADPFILYLYELGATDLPALIVWWEGLPAEYTTLINDLTVTALQSITTAENDGVNAVTTAETTALASIDSVVTNAANNAVTQINNMTIGTDVALTAGGSFTFPASLNTNDKFNFNLAGDLETSNFTLNMNGHKFLGVSHATIEWNKNAGAELIYISTGYGFGYR